jgi:hypothetical protein
MMEPKLWTLIDRAYRQPEDLSAEAVNDHQITGHVVIAQ